MIVSASIIKLEYDSNVNKYIDFFLKNFSNNEISFIEFSELITKSASDDTYLKELFNKEYMRFIHATGIEEMKHIYIRVKSFIVAYELIQEIRKKIENDSIKNLKDLEIMIDQKINQITHDLSIIKVEHNEY